MACSCRYVLWIVRIRPVLHHSPQRCPDIGGRKPSSQLSEQSFTCQLFTVLRTTRDQGKRQASLFLESLTAYCLTVESPPPRSQPAAKLPPPLAPSRK